MKRSVTIVGGGLAGLTLGIRLLQEGIPVSIWEAGTYPRHRVCGEFISGAGLASLRRLAVLELLMNQGAQAATTVLFASGQLETAPLPLPSSALCVSRKVLDFVLSRHFVGQGGHLKVSSSWNQAFTEGIVRATGRRPNPISRGWRWYGLKAHAKGVTLGADLEMHLAPDAYVGLCRIESGKVNVCGLFRKRLGLVEPEDSLQKLRGNPGSLLHRRLGAADFVDGSFCSVAGLELTPQAPHPGECRIGDAVTMIPPITGNGMSLALESAELSAPPLVDYAESRISWAEMLGEQRRRTLERFAERLFWANQSHKLLFSNRLELSSLVHLLQLPFALRLLFRLTR